MALFPWNAVTPGVAPANPLLFDIAFMFHPWLLHAATEIAAGHFPLWNPHAFTGAPFFANPQTALLFPLTALAYVLPLPTAIALAAVLKLATAGLGTYWFMRQLAVAPWPALVAATVFMLSGPMVVWLHWSFGSTEALLPLTLATTEWLRRRADAVAVAGLALTITLLMLAGYPQGAAFGTLLAAAWALARAHGAARPRRFLLLWPAGVALGVTMSAVQILPFLEYLGTSAVLAYRQEWLWPMWLPARAVVALLMPYYYGSPTGDDFWGPMNFNELTTTVGLTPWIALPLAVGAARRGAEARFFLGVGALAAAMVYGVPGLAPVLAALPLFSMAIPTRMAAFLALALAVLTALGLDAALKAPPAAHTRVRRGVRGAFAVLATVAFAFVVADYARLVRVPMRIPVAAQYAAFLVLLTAAAVAVLGLVADPWRARWWPGILTVQLASSLPLAVTYNPVIDVGLFYGTPPPLVRHLRESATTERGRVLFKVFGAANLGTMFGLDEAGGYDGITPRRIDDLVDPEGSLDSLASGALRVTAPLASPVIDLVGIRHVAVPPDGEDLAPWPLEWDGPGGRVYRNPRALPRAFVAFRARTCVDDRRALDLIRGGSVALEDEVLIAECEGAPEGASAGRVRQAEIREYAAERVVVHAVTDAPAWLVLTDAWFPGWGAWVNGSERPIHRANYAFRAVWLPAGRHDVEFRYEPRSVRYGLAASLGAMAVVAGLLLRGRRRA